MPTAVEKRSAYTFMGCSGGQGMCSREDPTVGLGELGKGVAGGGVRDCMASQWCWAVVKNQVSSHFFAF